MADAGTPVLVRLGEAVRSLNWPCVTVGVLFALGGSTRGYFHISAGADLLALPLVLWLVALKGVRPWWAFGLAAIPLAQLPFSGDPLATGLASLRWFDMAIAAAWSLRSWSWSSFAIGALYILGFEAAAYPQVWATGRHPGFAPTISTLGAVGYGAFIATPWRPLRGACCGWTIAALTLATAAARAPVVGVLAYGATRFNWRVLLAGIACAGVVWGVGKWNHQVSRLVQTSAIVSGLEGRLATITGDECSAVQGAYGQDYVCGPGTWRWAGSGANAYLSVNPWPRPHNLFVLVAFEMGLLLIPLGALGAAYLRRYWLTALPFAAGTLAYGLLDDSLWQPQGQWVLGTGLLVTAGLAGASVPLVAAVQAHSPAKPRRRATPEPGA